MRDWYVSIALNARASDDQADFIAQQVGSTFVDPERNRTRVTAYTTASSVRQAVNDCLERVNVAASKTGFEAIVVEVVVKTEEDRIAELSAAGVPEVVGVAEIQGLLHINTRQQVNQLAERSDFPQPVAELRAGRIWLRADIDDFGRRWQRKPGRASTK